MTPATLYEEIRTLPPHERRRLVERILHDLAEPPARSAAKPANTLVEFLLQSPLHAVDLEGDPGDEEMPEIDPSVFERHPGRGHHAHLRPGELVAVDADLWEHFGSSEAVNAALRGLVEATRHMPRTGS